MANHSRMAGIKRATLGLRVCLTIAIATAPRLASAQSLPGTNLTARIKVSAVTMSHDTSFVSYSVSNSPSSLEKLFSFMVVVPGTHATVARPGLATQYRVSSSWRGLSVARWAALVLIPQGDSMPTLQFHAKGLPGIATGWYHGDSLFTIDSNDSTTIVPNYDPVTDLSRKITTVGVDSFPNPSYLSALTSRLRPLTDSSCAQRWITDTGLCTRLHAILSGVVTPFLQYANSLDSARTSGAAVTDQAYFLLHANVGYIKAFVQPTALSLATACGRTVRLHNGNYGPVTVTVHFVGSATVDSSVSLPGKATDADFLYVVTTADPSVTSVLLIYNGTTLGTVTPGGPPC